jgi:hypothetical protein
MIAGRLADVSQAARGAPPTERELLARLQGGLLPRAKEAPPREAVEDVLLLRRLLAPPQQDLAETLA